MIRTQIQLEEGQYKKLKSLAARRALSISRLVREGVDKLLSDDERSERWRRLRGAVGSCHDPAGTGDVAARHDHYLADACSND